MPDPAPDPSLASLLRRAIRRAAQTGRRELVRAADAGRQQLELRQARADLQDFWVRLGRTTYRLAESGEVDHPAILKACERIDKLQARIDELEAQLDDGAAP